MESCHRCEESEATLQCADCTNDDSAVLFCEECSSLVHKGKFAAKHKLTSLMMKEKKVETQKKLQEYQKDVKVVDQKLLQLNYLDKDLQELFRVHERNIRCSVIKLQEELKKKAMEMIKDAQEYVQDKSQQINEAREALQNDREAMMDCQKSIKEVLDLDDVTFASQAKDENNIIYQEWAMPDMTEISIPSTFMVATVDFSDVTEKIEELQIHITDLEEKPDLKLASPKFEAGEELEVILCSSLQRNGTFSVSPIYTDDAIITLSQMSVEIRLEMLRDLGWRTYADMSAVPEKNERVYAQHPTDNKWYRASVITAAEPPKNESFVLFLDYGNMMALPPDKLLPWREVAPNCHGQAMICTMMPSVAMTMQREAMWVFHDHTKDLRLFCKLINKLEDEIVWCVELYSQSGDNQGSRTLVNDAITPLVNVGAGEQPTIGCRDIRYQHEKATIVMVETKPSPSRPTEKSEPLVRIESATSSVVPSDDNIIVGPTQSIPQDSREISRISNADVGNPQISSEAPEETSDPKSSSETKNHSVVVSESSIEALKDTVKATGSAEITQDSGDVTNDSSSASEEGPKQQEEIVEDSAVLAEEATETSDIAATTSEISQQAEGVRVPVSHGVVSDGTTESDSGTEQVLAEACSATNGQQCEPHSQVQKISADLPSISVTVAPDLAEDGSSGLADLAQDLAEGRAEMCEGVSDVQSAIAGCGAGNNTESGERCGEKDTDVISACEGTEGCEPAIDTEMTATVELSRALKVSAAVEELIVHAPADPILANGNKRCDGIGGSRKDDIELCPQDTTDETSTPSTHDQESQGETHSTPDPVISESSPASAAHEAGPEVEYRPVAGYIPPSPPASNNLYKAPTPPSSTTVPQAEYFTSHFPSASDSVVPAPGVVTLKSDSASEASIVPSSESHRVSDDPPVTIKPEVLDSLSQSQYAAPLPPVTETIRPPLSASPGRPVLKDCGILQREQAEGCEANAGVAGQETPPISTPSSQLLHQVKGSPGRVGPQTSDSKTSSPGSVSKMSQKLSRVPVSPQSAALQKIIENIPSLDGRSHCYGQVVSELDAHGRFWFRFSARTNFEKEAVKMLEQNLQKFAPLMTSVADPAEHDVVLVKYKDNWHRGRISAPLGNNSNKIQVFLVDLGLRMSTLSTNVRSATDTFRHIPHQAIQCSIASHGYTEFKESTRELFDKICKGKECQAVMVQMGVDPDSSLYYSIRLFTDIDGQFSSVYDTLCQHDPPPFLQQYVVHTQPRGEPSSPLRQYKNLPRQPVVYPPGVLVDLTRPPPSLSPLAPMLDTSMMYGDGQLIYGAVQPPGQQYVPDPDQLVQHLAQANYSQLVGDHDVTHRHTQPRVPQHMSRPPMSTPVAPVGVRHHGNSQPAHAEVMYHRGRSRPQGDMAPSHRPGRTMSQSSGDSSHSNDRTSDSPNRQKSTDHKPAPSQAVNAPASGPANAEDAFDNDAWIEDESDHVNEPWKGHGDGRSKPRQHHNGTREHLSSSPKYSSSDKKPCFCCGGYGHFANDCPQKTSNTKANKRTQRR